MDFYWLTLGSLAVWRITQLLNAEDGPRDLFVRLRKIAGAGFWGNLLDCFYCLSLWIAAPVAWWIGASWMQKLLLWPAMSAGAILIERLSAPQRQEQALYFETPEEVEDRDVLLRKEERGSGSSSSRAASSAQGRL
jgi:hypothetical protein